jgi:hypothetical protein
MNMDFPSPHTLLNLNIWKGVKGTGKDSHVIQWKEHWAGENDLNPGSSSFPKWICNLWNAMLLLSLSFFCRGPGGFRGLNPGPVQLSTLSLSYNLSPKAVGSKTSVYCL